MNVPLSRSLIPLGILAVAAALLTFDVISLDAFLTIAFIMITTSTILVIAAITCRKKKAEKQHGDTTSR